MTFVFYCAILYFSTSANASGITGKSDIQNLQNAGISKNANSLPACYWSDSCTISSASSKPVAFGKEVLPLVPASQSQSSLPSQSSQSKVSSTSSKVISSKATKGSCTVD